MSLYLALKLLHLLSAGVLFGTGIGIAYFKWTADRSGNLGAIRVTSERVVVADAIFTAVAVVVQPVTGIAMALMAGFPVFSGWVGWSLLLYVLVGLCWLPVVRLQIVMRDLARAAETAGTPLPEAYRRHSRTWFLLGMPALAALLLVYGLMVFKPS